MNETTEKDVGESAKGIEPRSGDLFEMSAQDAFEGDFDFEPQASYSAQLPLPLAPIVGGAISKQNTVAAEEAQAIDTFDTLALKSASTLDSGDSGGGAGGPVGESEELGEVGEPREPSIDLAEIARIIPNKMAFKIGEVAEITDLKPYVLRYWESEFEALNPQKSAFNQRMYSRRDVETVLLIKKLLYEEKFSIAGAKRKLKEMRRELKTEKQWLEINERVELATDRVAELVEEINSLRNIFA